MLIGVAGNDTADTGGVRAGEQQSTRARECHLHPARLGEERSVSGARVGRYPRMTLLETCAELRLELIQPGRQRPARHESLENSERRCDGDVTSDELRDQRPNGITVWIHCAECFLPSRLTRALIRLLVRDEIG